jgi:hypothetical protein
LEPWQINEGKALNTLYLMLKTLCSRYISSAEQVAQNTIIINFILDALKIPYELNAINSNNVLIPSISDKNEVFTKTMDWTNLPKLPLNQGGTYIFNKFLD